MIFGYKLELYFGSKPDCNECCTRNFAIFDLNGFTFENKPKKLKKSHWLLNYTHNRQHEKGWYIFVTLFRQQVVFHGRKIVRVYTKEELIET